MGSKARWAKIPAELAREVHRLIGEGRTEAEIVESVGIAKSSVFRIRHSQDPLLRRREWTPRSGCLSLSDRVEIAVGLGGGESFTTIAGRIGCHVSSVSREVGGRRGRRSYRPEAAHRRAAEAARRPKPSKLATNPVLCGRVIDGLEKLWSPQQISAKLRSDYPNNPEMWVSHETIYQSLFVQGRGELRRELTKCLRTGRVRRKPRSDAPPSGNIPEPVPISARPPEVDDRAVPGHWEGDLIIGAGGKSAVGTLVERSTRYVMLFRLGDSHNAHAVRQAMTATIRTLPSTLFKTLTWDRGSEMARHREFTIDTGIQVYFCDPHSPWQRDSNENTNGLLRQYMPKSSDLSVHSDDDLQTIADSLNGRPRQTLDWQNPTEVLQQLLATTS